MSCSDVNDDIFCIIRGTDLDAIYKLLKSIFPHGYSDSDRYPTIYKGDSQIALWLPYYESHTEFYKVGLEAILDKYFKDNYTIEY